MKHLELHILQSFPVSCLNRDDLGSPKTAIFGGVQRARVSSQCWKRAIRELMQKESDYSEVFQGKRGRWIIDKFQAEIKSMNENDKAAKALAICAGHYLAKIDAQNTNRVKTSLFISPIELKNISKSIVGLEKERRDKLIDAVGRINLSDIERETEEEKEESDNMEDKKQKEEGNKLTPKKFTQLVEKILKPVFSSLFKNNDLKGLPKDAADIGVFGRMVANDPSLDIEGAAMFNHALSVHRVDNEMDYFSTVEEFKHDDVGAAMTGTLEFNSATYYRFAALNLDMLFDKEHLASLAEKERKEVVKAFVRATIEAVPMARRNSMNGDVRPKYVLCVIREKGHPVQLINAFEEPIFSKSGLVKKANDALEGEYKELKEKWGVSALTEIRIPEKSLSELLSEVEEYVQ